MKLTLEKDLIEDLRAGDERAFEVLVKQNQSKVYNLCLSILQNTDDADDLSQEVFIEAFRSISKFRNDAKISTWLYSIASYKCLEELRRRKRKRRWAVVKSMFAESYTEEPAEFDHPGVRLENKERAKVLFDKINQLPDNQKVAFTLHKVEGVPYQEVAEIMNLSLSAVESLMHRAKANLKKLLNDYYYENES